MYASIKGFQMCKKIVATNLKKYITIPVPFFDTPYIIKNNFLKCTLKYRVSLQNVKLLASLVIELQNTGVELKDPVQYILYD